jgi:hypothetical protein
MASLIQRAFSNKANKTGQHVSGKADATRRVKTGLAQKERWNVVFTTGVAVQALAVVFKSGIVITGVNVRDFETQP